MSPPRNQEAAEFLNPKSMLTPGVAGGFVMVIGQALAHTLPFLSLPITLMALSFIVGALLLVGTNVRLWKRMIYYILNSLFIFAMAVGVSATASTKDETPQQRKQRIELEASLTDAQEQLNKLKDSEAQLRDQLAKQADDKKTKEELEKLKQQAAVVQGKVDSTTKRLDQATKLSPRRLIRKVF
jgi:uncharacterized protein YlxW (UPF0749 family)